MTTVTRPWWQLVAVLGIASQAVLAQSQPPTDTKPLTVGNVPVAKILTKLGARLEKGVSPGERDGHARQFDRTDTNRDGKHSRKEYVDGGRYLTPRARSGIFRAADGNGDGVVTRAEYILNRIITDEAKNIVQRMDDDRDGSVERREFVGHSKKPLGGEKLAGQVFSALDPNGDGVILVPEYLRVWGKWARSGHPSAEKRIAALPAETGDSKNQRAGSRGERPERFGPPGGRGSRFGGGPPSPEEFVKRAFQFDADKDGKLDRKELTKLAESLGRRRGGRSGSGRRGRFGSR